jgi:anaerobic selenocysteine-containing dehydrogenase
LIERLATLEPQSPLVLIPRRQARKLNGGLDFLGESAEVLLPEDARDAGVVDGQPALVRTTRGSSRALRRWMPASRRGVVSVPHGHHGASVNPYRQ